MALLFDEASATVPTKYFNYSNIFLVENVTKLLEHIKINDFIIELEKSKQLCFRPIYNLESVKLETLKIYIKTNLANNFIRSFKSSVGAFIFFD